MQHIEKRAHLWYVYIVSISVYYIKTYYPNIIIHKNKSVVNLLFIFLKGVFSREFRISKGTKTIAERYAGHSKGDGQIREGDGPTPG